MSQTNSTPTTADLHYQVQGQGTPVLMIHGIISDGSFFDGTAAYLSRCHTVLTYDRRGYGLSTKQTYSDYTVRTQAEDAADLLRRTELGAAYILGNSAGGLIGLELALHHPELVRGLLMIEPSLGYDGQEQKKLLEWNAELNRHAQSGRIKRALPAFSRVIGAPEGASGSASLAELKRTYQNLSAFLYGELNEVQHYLPPLEQLKQLSVPVMIAVTERGRESIFATSSATAADIIGWPLIHLPGYHNVAKDMPLDFAVAVHGVFSGMELGAF